jgi:hypothetical protein
MLNKNLVNGRYKEFSKSEKSPLRNGVEKIFMVFAHTHRGLGNFIVFNNAMII